MELTDLAPLTDPSLREAVSVLQSPEPLVLRLDGVAGDGVAAAAALHRLPTVTVLHGRPGDAPPAVVDAVDVCLTDDPDPPRPWVCATPDAIEIAVADQPEASLALAGLLRTTATLPVWDAIAAEAATYGMLLGGRGFRAWLDQRGPATPKPHNGEPVLVERDGDRVRITLNRPEARNAIDSRLRDALVDALEQAHAEWIELRGAGPCFSSGGDLHEFGSSDPALTYAVRLTRHPGRAVADVAGRTTAQLHGACIGAGIEVPAFAGTVVADPGTTFRLPEVGMGLVPGAGGTVSLPRRIGRQRTAWLALTGATLDAAEARRWGLVDRSPA